MTIQGLVSLFCIIFDTSRMFLFNLKTKHNNVITKQQEYVSNIYHKAHGLKNVEMNTDVSTFRVACHHLSGK